MNIHEAIRNRRSVGRVKPDPVHSKLIEQILEAGIWAPNHYETEPWRFYVMVGEARSVLGRAYADIAVENAQGLSDEEQQSLRSKQEQKAFRAPVVIAVSAASTGGKAPWIEELAAVHASVQNMLLTAFALGLGAIWRTGKPAYHEIMHKAFQLNEAEQLVGFLYIGYPDMVIPQGRRISYKEKTVWL
jgi:nitroreductase